VNRKFMQKLDLTIVSRFFYFWFGNYNCEYASTS